MAGTAPTSIKSYHFGKEDNAPNGVYAEVPFVNPTGQSFVPHSVMIINDGANDILISVDGVTLFMRLKVADKNFVFDFFHHRQVYLQGVGANVPYRLAAW